MKSTIEIDFNNRNRPPIGGLGEQATVVTEDGGNHPFLGYIGVRTAHDVNMVFTNAGCTQQRITAHDGPGNDFGSVIAQSPRDFGEEAVVTDHHTDFAKSRLKDRIVVTGGYAPFDFSAR